jgi:hypothetical protein
MNVKEAAVLLIRRLEIDANLLLKVDEDRRLRHPTSGESSTVQPRLVDVLPAKLEEAPLVSLEQIVRVGGHLEEQLDAKQFICAASHHAAEEP